MPRSFELRHLVDSFWRKRYGGRGSSTPAPPADDCRILLEDGSLLLLETGDNFLLEGCAETNRILLEDGFAFLTENGDFLVLES